MRKYLLAVALVAIGLLAASKPQVPTTFEFACKELAELTDASCKGLEPPIVVETALLVLLEQVTHTIWHGVTFSSENYVFVNKKSRLPKDEIIVHETTHYILNNQGQRIGKCRSEELARRVHSKWSNVPYTADWKPLYGCI